MASSSLLSIVITALFILTLTCPPTSARRKRPYDGDDINDPDLHDLCEQTRKPKLCREIMRADMGRFEDGRDRSGVTEAIVDLARAKAEEIHGNLNSYYYESTNDELKEKYISCSKNYKDIMRNLEVARDNIVSRAYRRNQVQVDDALEELKNCRHQFDGNTFDPAHIRNRNKEFGVYLDMVKVSTEHLDREYELFDGNRDWKN